MCIHRSCLPPLHLLWDSPSWRHFKAGKRTLSHLTNSPLQIFFPLSLVAAGPTHTSASFIEVIQPLQMCETDFFVVLPFWRFAAMGMDALDMQIFAVWILNATEFHWNSSSLHLSSLLSRRLFLHRSTALGLRQCAYQTECELLTFRQIHWGQLIAVKKLKDNRLVLTIERSLNISSKGFEKSFKPGLLTLLSHNKNRNCVSGSFGQAGGSAGRNLAAIHVGGQIGASLYRCASRLEFLQSRQASRVSGDLPQGERTWLASIWVFAKICRKIFGTHFLQSSSQSSFFVNLQISHFLPLESCPERHRQGGASTLPIYCRICIAHPCQNSWKTLGGSRSARNVRLSETIRANQATSLSSKCQEFTKAFLGSHHTWKDLEWVSFCLRSSDHFFASFLLHRLPCLLLSYIRSRLCGLRQSKDFRHSQPTNWCRLLAGAVFRNSFCFNINILWNSATD